MQLITGYKDLSNTKGVVCTIGSFDGVHQGHHYLIQYTNRIAHQQGLKSLIITFRNHPRKTLHPQQPTWLLSTYEEKLRLISQLSPDYCMVLDFNEHLSQLSANEFILSYLKPLNVKTLVMGYDHHFGHERNLSPSDYNRLCSNYDIQVIHADKFTLQSPSGQSISSSHIRKLITQGNVSEATIILGHPYSLYGKVIHGQNIGTQLGFPTANLQPSPDKLIPAEGVYAVIVTSPTTINPLPAMLYIGNRPTIESNNQKSIEVNIFNFDGNLYGTELWIEFIQYIRPQQQFPSLKALQQQLEKDKRTIQQLL